MSTVPQPTFNLVAIVTETNGVFLSKDRPLSSYEESYGDSGLSGLIVDGAIPQPSYHRHWVRVDKQPAKIERVIPASRKVIGYKLRTGFVASERLPESINIPSLRDTVHEGVSECYDPVYETIPESRIDVPFSIHVIAERANWQPTKTEFQPQYGLLDRITLNPVLLPERPCRLTVDESFAVIATHIVKNLNPKVARALYYENLRCITVYKIIGHEPKPHSVTVGTKRRPRTETRYTTSREVQVFETAGHYSGTSPYSGHTLVTPFEGANYDDLQANITSYLNDLMATLNEPLRDCPHCKGRGVLIEEAKS